MVRARGLRVWNCYDFRVKFKSSNLRQERYSGWGEPEYTEVNIWFELRICAASHEDSESKSGGTVRVALSISEYRARVGQARRSRAGRLEKSPYTYLVVTVAAAGRVTAAQLTVCQAESESDTAGYSESNAGSRSLSRWSLRVTDSPPRFGRMAKLQCSYWQFLNFIAGRDRRAGHLEGPAAGLARHGPYAQRRWAAPSLDPSWTDFVLHGRLGSSMQFQCNSLLDTAFTADPGPSPH